MGAAEYVPVGPGYVPAPRPRIGRLVGFVAQPGLGGPSFGWVPRAEPPEYVDLSYVIIGGREGGRALDGALRTYIRPPATDWATIDRLAGAHLVELANREPHAEPAEPVWDDIVVLIDDVRCAARQTIFHGYEGVAFPLGDRIGSSAFSVFDASIIDARYRTIYAPWPDEHD